MELDFPSFPNSAISQMIYMLTRLQIATSNTSGKVIETLAQLHTHTVRPWGLACSQDDELHFQGCPRGAVVASISGSTS